MSDRLTVINGLRGFAICAVIWHHAFAHRTPPGFGSIELGGVQWLPLAPLSNGWLGVSLFFVLSGFVLALPYEQERRRMESGPDAIAFYLRRAARLLPLYYLASLIGFVFFAPPPTRSVTSFAMLLTATFNFSADTFFPAYNWVLWSLGIEIWMSIFFPLLLLLRRRLGLWTFFAATLVFSATFRFYGNQPFFWGRNPVLNWMKDGLAGRLDDFALGMVLAAVFVARRDRALGTGPRLAALAIAAVAGWLTCVGWDAIRLGQLSRELAPLLNNLFQLACAAGILGLLFAPLGSPLRLLVANRPMQLLGMMCFSLYVWHGMLLWRAGLQAPGGFTATNLAIYFAFLAAISTLTYRTVEFGQVRDLRALFVPPAPRKRERAGSSRRTP